MAFRTFNRALTVAAFTAAASLAAVTTADAAVVVSLTTTHAGLPPGHQMVWDFDGVQDGGYGVLFSPGSGVRSVAAGVTSSAAPPPGASGLYAAVRGGGTMTLTTPGIKALSVFMGSPDSYNSIVFNYLDGTSESLNGFQLAAGAFGGDQSIGRRMTYVFSGPVGSVVFGSAGDSFEFDNIAALSAVPEPTSWALMITGFGLAGLALRRRVRPALCA